MSEEVKESPSMSEEEIQKYVDFVMSQLNEDGTFTEEGETFIAKNVPNPDDQVTITKLVEEKYNAQKANNGAEENPNSSKEESEQVS